VSKPASKPAFFLDPIKEARAVASLKDSLAKMGAADDEEIVESSIEGETSLYEAIDLMLERIRNAQVMTEGLAAVIAGLESRKARYAKTIETHRTLIEQALMIAEIEEKIERPTATVSLAARQPKVEVQTEADIPARFFNAAPPVLDKKALLAALKERAKAVAEVSDLPAEEREAAIAALPPEIPGACLSNAAPSINIRVK
jgi:hypothetical protein